MEVEKPLALDHFSSFLPCKFSFSSDSIQHQCMLSLDITKTYVKFYIFEQGRTSSNPTEFDFEKYNALLVSSLFCTFINLSNQNTATFYFLPDNANDMINNNLRRFVFALADAGMLSYDPNDTFSETYKNLIIFRFIPEHSFVPDGIYSFVYTAIYRNVRAICVSRIKSVMNMKETPFNPKFMDFIIPSIQSIERQRISSTRASKKSKYDSNFLFQHHFKIINKILEKSNDDDIYTIFKAEINKVKDERFEMIESDCKAFNQLIKNKEKNKKNFFLSQIDTKKWNEKLSIMCMNVCKVHILSDNSNYFKNNFLIAMRIAIFLKNGENIENLAKYSSSDNKAKDIEEFKSKLSSLTLNKTDDEIEIMIYFFYKLLVGSLTSDVAHSLAYNFSMDIFEYFAPSAKSFFVYYKIRSFEWIEKDVKELFVNTLKSPWIFWLFILKINNSERAYQSLIASVIYNSIPKLVNQNIIDEESISDFWPNFQRSLQNDSKIIQDILDVATYIYDGSAMQNAF